MPRYVAEARNGPAENRLERGTAEGRSRLCVALVDLRELRDRIDRGSVVVVQRQAVGPPRPAAGIVGERIGTTPAARPAARSEPVQAFTRRRSYSVI
jgi:hypothetical protein